MGYYRRVRFRLNWEKRNCLIASGYRYKYVVFYRKTLFITGEAASFPSNESEIGIISTRTSGSGKADQAQNSCDVTKSRSIRGIPVLQTVEDKDRWRSFPALIPIRSELLHHCCRFGSSGLGTSGNCSSR